MDIEKRRIADAKSKRKLYYPVTLRLHKKYDIDLIEQIKKQSNKRQYLMDLIRQDIKKGGKRKMKIYGTKQAPEDMERWFWFDEKGCAHAYKFDDDNGHENDDTQYIDGSKEVYINGYYVKKEDWTEVKEG